MRALRNPAASANGSTPGRVLDYHLHLWPHEESDVALNLDQIAAYCERAQAAGVVEIALTEHLFRFTQSRALMAGLFADEPSALAASMDRYWDHHARTDLDDYVELATAAKAAGLPVVVGLEVDHYRGRMEQVRALLSGYPFDVLLGSVHWIGAWRFDDLSDPLHMAEWSVRDVDAAWSAYTGAIEELAESGTCDVLAHPDLVKAAAHWPDQPAEWWDRLAEAAAADVDGGRGVLGRLAQELRRAVSGAPVAREDSPRSESPSRPPPTRTARCWWPTARPTSARCSTRSASTSCAAYSGRVGRPVPVGRPAER